MGDEMGNPQPAGGPDGADQTENSITLNIPAIRATGPMIDAIYDNPARDLRRMGEEGWRLLGAGDLDGVGPSQFDSAGRFTGREINYAPSVRRLLDSGNVTNYLNPEGQRLWRDTVGRYDAFRNVYNPAAGRINDGIDLHNRAPWGDIPNIPLAPSIGNVAVQQMAANSVDMNGQLHAMAAQRGDTLILSFRGSVTGGDGWAATFDQHNFYESGRPFYDAVRDYVTDPANGVNNVYVTGHSLGGAMAQIYAFRDMPALEAAGLNVQAVAYASPGVRTSDVPDANNPPDNLITVQGLRDNVSNQDLAPGPGDVLEMRNQVNSVRRQILSYERQAISAADQVPLLGDVAIIGIGRAATAADTELLRLQRLAERSRSTALEGHTQWDDAEIYYDFPHRPDNSLGNWNPQHSWVRSRHFAEVIGEAVEDGARFAPGEVLRIDDRDRRNPVLIQPEAPDPAPDAEPSPAENDPAPGGPVSFHLGLPGENPMAARIAAAPLPKTPEPIPAAAMPPPSQRHVSRPRLG